MTELESNVQAYRTMAEMLVGLRKIVLHGLRKQCGDRWPTEGCPSRVYERLVARKENELAIQRLAPEDEDLMSFATFEDLAETIQGNQRLAALLHNLAPSAEVLCARLTDLEALRAKMARAIVLNDDELSLLNRYSSHLRDTLAGVRRRTGKGEGEAAPRAREPGAGSGAQEARARPRSRTRPPEVAPVTPPEVAPVTPPPTTRDTVVVRTPDVNAQEVHEGEPGTAAGAAPRIAEQKPAASPEVQAPSSGRRGAGSELTGPPPGDTPQVKPRPAASSEVQAPSSGRRGAGSELAGPPPGDTPQVKPRPAAFDPESLAEDVQTAMVDEDDPEVLRLLRREIIAAAEAMYRGEGEIPVRGWQEVVRDGWLERSRDELVLAPLEQFHRLLEEYEERRRSGEDSRESLQRLLAEHEFPRLLLHVRETFVRNGL